VSSHVAPTTTR